MFKEKFDGYEGYTGRLLESEILPSLPDSWKDEGYFTEERSLGWVRKNQPWNPSDPENKIANDLHYRVAEKLEIEDFNKLKFYSALGSPLDKFYGIDAFFEIGDARFTLDLTMNPHKLTHKADYVIQEDLTTEEGVIALAEIVAVHLKGDMSRRYVDIAA